MSPNRSLELRRIMYLWQTVFLPFCRRRSGLRRNGTEEKTAAEGHKTARSNNITIEIKTLRSNDRFGIKSVTGLTQPIPAKQQTAANGKPPNRWLPTHWRRASFATQKMPSYHAKGHLSRPVSCSFEYSILRHHAISSCTPSCPQPVPILYFGDSP